MASIHFSITFVFQLMLGFLSLITTEAVVEYLYHVCSNTTTFTPNSTYEANLNHLLSSLSSNSTRSNINGFYNTTAGGGSPGAETIYGLFLCRGDLSTGVCQECISTAAEEVLVRRCPTNKVSVIWYAECMIRYSNQSIFSTVATTPSVPLVRTRNFSENITEQERFIQLLARTITALAGEAASDQTAGEKFAVKQANFTWFQMLYTMAQCTPDLTPYDCFNCLGVVVGNLPNCCNGKQGGRVLFPSCNVRYEIYPFYDLNATASPPPPPPPLPPPPRVPLPAPTTKGNYACNGLKYCPAS